MSVYFIRHEHLVKIGYSSNLGARAAQIIGDIAGPAQFVGHMPGDREVEAHLHFIFGSDRFAGEWFVESERIRLFEGLALLPDLPKPNDPLAEFGRRVDADDAWAEASARMRKSAAHLWPESNHKDRICLLKERLGWTHRRVRSLYHAEPGGSLRSLELEEIAGLEAELADAAPTWRGVPSDD